MRVTITIVVENHSGFKKGLYGAHGFSALVEHKAKVLVDTGVDGEVLLKNMTELGISPEDIDYLFLTHSHYDHTGGLKSLLEARRGRLKIIAHPAVFSKRVALKPHLRDIGIPFSREELESLGADFILSNDPFQFAEGIWSSGEIERSTWDRAVGYLLKDGKLIRDPVKDDMALIIDGKDGITVITGCGHSGILNIARHAQKLMSKPVKALIGGFHLASAKEDILEDVVQNLKAEKLYAGHCTGVESFSYLRCKLGKKVEPLHVGKIIEL
ncbi:MBL fold metallo-hydrolase [Thermococcus sp.]